MITVKYDCDVCGQAILPLAFTSNVAYAVALDVEVESDGTVIVESVDGAMAFDGRLHVHSECARAIAKAIGWRAPESLPKFKCVSCLDTGRVKMHNEDAARPCACTITQITIGDKPEKGTCR